MISLKKTILAILTFNFTLICFITFLTYFPIAIEKSLNQFKSGEGFSYVYDIPFGFLMRSEKDDVRGMMLYENGKPLGPSSSSHDDIRKKGGGKYSHWGSRIYFSTSDNSNPNTNHRLYSLKYLFLLNPIFFYIVIFLFHILLAYYLVQFHFKRLQKLFNDISDNQKETTQIILWIFILVALLFYADKLVLGPHAPIRIHDNMDADIPWFLGIKKLLLEHGLFAWYPNHSGGMPVYATHYPPFHLFIILISIFPLWLCYSAITIFFTIIAGYGMYRFLNEYVQLSRWVSLAGGFSFLLVTQIQSDSLLFTSFNYAFPMFFIWFLDVVQSDKIFKSRLISLLGILFLFASSFFLLTVKMYPILQVVLILVFNTRFKGHTVKLLIWSVIIWTGYVLITTPMLYALIEYLPYQHRIYNSTPLLYFDFHLLKSIFDIGLSRFLTILKNSGLFIPLFGGLPLLLKSSKARRSSFLILMIILLLGFNETLLKSTFLAKLDLVHFYWLFPFLIILTVASMLEELFIGENKSKGFLLMTLAWGVIGSVSFFFLKSHPRGNYSDSLLFILNLLPFLLAISFYFTITIEKLSAKTTILLSMGFLLLMVFDARLYRYNGNDQREDRNYYQDYDNYDSFSKLADTNRKKPFRTMSGLGIDPHTLSYYGLETADARAPLFNKYFKSLFKQIILPQLRNSAEEHFFDNYFYNLTTFQYFDNNRLNIPILLMANVKYIVSGVSIPYLNHFAKKISQIPATHTVVPAYLYELKNSFERGFLVHKAEVISSSQKLLHQLPKLSVADFKESAFFSADHEIPADIESFNHFNDENNNIAHNDDLKLIQYSPDKIQFKVKLKSPAILIVTNNYDPKWNAKVNGINNKIYRVNEAFQGLVLNHTGVLNITFEYHDNILWYLHWLILLGFLMILSPILFLIQLSNIYKVLFC